MLAKVKSLSIEKKGAVNEAEFRQIYQQVMATSDLSPAELGGI